MAIKGVIIKNKGKMNDIELQQGIIYWAVYWNGLWTLVVVVVMVRPDGASASEVEGEDPPMERVQLV